MSLLFQFITLFNFGPDVPAPKLEFYKQSAAGKDRAETYDLARQMGARPSKKGMLKELSIAEAETDEDALLPDAPQAPAAAAQPPQPPQPNAQPQPQPTARQFSAELLDALAGWTFAKAVGMGEQEAVDLATNAADAAIETAFLAPVYQMLVQYERDGKSLAQFRDDLAAMVGDMDDTALRDVVEGALQFGIASGGATTTP
jgi:hypothetical protein